MKDSERLALSEALEILDGLLFQMGNWRRECRAARSLLRRVLYAHTTGPSIAASPPLPSRETPTPEEPFGDPHGGGVSI